MFCFVLFCFVLFCFVLFCFVLFCFVLFCFVLFCFVLFCFVLFCFVLFCLISNTYTTTRTEFTEVYSRITRPELGTNSRGNLSLLFFIFIFLVIHLLNLIIPITYLFIQIRTDLQTYLSKLLIFNLHTQDISIFASTTHLFLNIYFCAREYPLPPLLSSIPLPYSFPPP